jgi:hypothetical protein
MLWHYAMLGHIIPQSAKLFFSEDAPFFGLDQGKTGKALVCAKRAVLYGASVYAFPDWMTAHNFREKVYAAEGLQMPAKPPLSVTILDRKKFKPRHIDNQKEVGPDGGHGRVLMGMRVLVRMLSALFPDPARTLSPQPCSSPSCLRAPQVIDMIRSLGVEPTVAIWEGTTTFQEQVTTLSQTGVFIALHGAGLMNEIFLPPGSVVIEIFPPHVKHVLYERICHNSGVYHFKVPWGAEGGL